MSYKWCAVSKCRSTSVQTPEKLFITVPKDAKRRNTWLRLAGRDSKNISFSSVIFFCEDHFDMEKDMDNYIKYKMGFSHRIKMVDGALPSKFQCQQDQRRGQPTSVGQTKHSEGCESVIDPNIILQKEDQDYVIQQIKMLDKQREQRRKKCKAGSVKTKKKNECEDIDPIVCEQLEEDTRNEGTHRLKVADDVVFSKFHNQLDQDLFTINSEGSSFRTISIEVLKTELLDDEDITDSNITIQNVNEDPITKDSYTPNVALQEAMECENNLTTVSHHTWYKNAAEKSVQFCYKPIVRSMAAQTSIETIKHVTTDRSTSPFQINTNHSRAEPTMKEIRELETLVRISDRKLFRSWESIKDSKDPEEYENLLDEVKNKQKTLSCMLQLIENRQALLSREQEKEDENDAVVSLPTQRHQGTRRCFKRRKRAHESRSDHKNHTAPKQVTLYITGSNTVDETESTRSSSELPSLEPPQGPAQNIMFFTTNLT